MRPYATTMTPIDADPYAWPWDGGVAIGRLAIVVAGAQQYWFDRTDAPAAALATLELLLTPLRALAVPVIRIRHGRVAARRLSIPVQGSADWELVAPVGTRDIIVDAAGLDGCYGSSLDSTLRTLGTDLILMAGLGLEGPVHSTLRSLNDRGYECLTVTDAAAPHLAELAGAAISTITLSFGIFGAVASSAAVLSVLTPEVVST
jgi:biuret amidohydrolase